MIGGGLAGLCAALELEKQGRDVRVLEAADELGGQIKTVTHAGCTIELGAEGFVSRSDVLPALAKRVGIEHELRGQTQTRSLGFRAGELRELAPGEAAAFLGFQVSKNDLGLGIRTFAPGMGALITALSRALAANVELHTGWQAASLARTARGYVIKSAEGASFEANELVIATSARHASKLCAGLFGAPALALAQARVVSSVTVSLAYPREAIAHPLDATGFVVASEDQQHGARACAFVSSKFADRAPADTALLRVFFRPTDTDLRMTSDATYTQWAGELITRVLGVTTPPQHSWVSRWRDALPMFDDAHRQHVQDLETALAGSGIALAGSAFHGAGIDAAVRSALNVQQRL